MGFMARLALFAGSMAASDAAGAACEDAGPWPCNEDGCPGPVVRCFDMRRDCARAFSYVFAKPPYGLADSAIWTQCRKTCNRCKNEKKKKKPTESVADACAASTLCLADAERALLSGDDKAARVTLGVGATGAYPRGAGAQRWLNVAALAMLLVGNVPQAVQFLEAVLIMPFSHTHLAAAKNLYWARHTLPPSQTGAAAHAQQEIEIDKSRLVQRFQQTDDAISRSSPEHLAATIAAEMSISIFDLPLARRVCTYELYDGARRADEWGGVDLATRGKRRYLDLTKRALTSFLSRSFTEDPTAGSEGEAETMEAGSCRDGTWHMGQGAATTEGPISQKWLSGLVHLELLVDDVIARRVEGDVIEAGCYAGGTAVLLRAAMEFEAAATRKLLLADSFEGIPQPRTALGKRIDTTASWTGEHRYVATLGQARSTLRRYGLLDERVVFVPGYFNESLPALPSERLALIHIDADAYDSVTDALVALYPRLTPGGHVVVDDFPLPGVRAAVLEFRERHRVRARAAWAAAHLPLICPHLR